MSRPENIVSRLSSFVVPRSTQMLAPSMSSMLRKRLSDFTIIPWPS
jgi:hypothetical protein